MFLWIVLASRRALLLIGLFVVACGARSGLDGLELTQSEGGRPSTSGGASSRAGASAAAGRSLGGAAGKPGGGAAGRVSAGGGRAGAGAGGSGGFAGVEAGGRGGVDVGGTNGGEPSAAAGPEGGRGGEPATPRAVDLALGAFHSCTGFDDGTLRCWGTGGYIGSGSGATIGDDETPDTLAPVVVGGPVKQVAASWYHTCAVLRSGKLRCWGNGGAGELGYGNTQDIGDDETPASAGDIDLGGIATRIDVGFLHACAVLDTGAVRCWGRAATGALGYGNARDVGDDETPASAGDVKL